LGLDKANGGQEKTRPGPSSIARRDAVGWIRPVSGLMSAYSRDRAPSHVGWTQWLKARS